MTNALAYQGQSAHRFGEARTLFAEAAAVWNSLGDGSTADLARTNIARAAKEEGDVAAAKGLLVQVVESTTSRGDLRGLAVASNALGDLAAASGEPDLARRHLESRLASFRQLDDRLGVANVLSDLANLDLIAGRFARAEHSLSEALLAFERLGHQRGLARQLEALSWCAAGLGRRAASVKLAAGAAAIRQRIRVSLGADERARAPIRGGLRTSMGRGSARDRGRTRRTTSPAERSRVAPRHQPRDAPRSHWAYLIALRSWRTAEMRLAGTPS
jgi:tetratricopeptide (TPR) repeat protein